jgi:hypothetical protein
MKNPGSPRSRARTRCGWPDRAHPCRTCAGKSVLRRRSGGITTGVRADVAADRASDWGFGGLGVPLAPGLCQLAKGEARPKQRRGGRRRENFGRQEEAEFLAPFFEQAKEGGVLIVTSKQRLGRPVACHRPITCYTATAGGSSPRTNGIRDRRLPATGHPHGRCRNVPGACFRILSNLQPKLPGVVCPWD